jgi:hypothetical protein
VSNPVSVFQEVKLELAETLAMSKDALHISVGLSVLLLAAALFRWPLRSWKPLAAVFVTAMAGEVWDFVDARRDGGSGDLWANWHDLWITCFWPVIVFLLARFTNLLKR